MTSAECQARYRARYPEKVREKAIRDKESGDGRRRSRAYEVRNPGRSAVKNARFRATEHGVVCYLYWNAKRRAKVGCLEFALTKEWIARLVEGGTCSMTGLPFSRESGRKPWAASLDRIDPAKGYTEENVRAVVWMYNACKAEFTDADVLVMSRALLEKTS